MTRWPFNRYTVADAMLWTASFLGMTARVVFITPIPHPWDITFRRVLVSLAGFALCELALPLLRGLRKSPIVAQAVVGLAFALGGSLFYGLMNHLVMYAYRPRLGPPAFNDMLFLASLQIYVFLAWGAIVIGLGYAEEAQEKGLKLLSAEKLAAESQASMLRYQLNPHFLFNTLNALSALILDRENPRAERLVLALSNFLRHALRTDAAALIPLREELAAQREYLTIEQIRFGARLIYVDAVPDALLDTAVPSFILQPLVENAVKYGVAPSTEPVTIRIGAESRPDHFRIVVQDDGKAAAASLAPRLGVGLENVRSRLELAYPGRGRLLAAPLPHGGFQAVLELPRQPAP